MSGTGALTVEKAERGLANAAALDPRMRYALESEWPEGLSCDHCGEWIVEPDEKDLVPCEECGHLHFDYAANEYIACPLADEGCGCDRGADQ